MSQSATEGGQGQESGTPNGTTQTGQESGQGAGQGQESAQQQQAGQQGTDQGIDLSTIQDPAVKAYLEKVQKDAQEARQEAARYRTERNTYQSKVSEFERQNESDQERQQREAQEAKERLEALEQENRDLRVGSALRTAATDAKAFNPNLVAEMLNSKVTLDDKGQPTNLQDLLKDLRQSDPYLFKRANNDGGEGTGQEQEPTGNMNDTIRAQIAARRGRA